MKVYISKTSRIYEFRGADKKMLSFLIRRMFAFIVDLIIIIGISYATTIFIKDFFIKYLIGTMFAMVYASTYNLITFFFMRGQTLGMKFMGLITVNKDGFDIGKLRLLTKGFVLSMYFVPFIGFGLIISSFITPILMRGVTLIDLWTRSAVITVTLYNEIVNEENKLIEKEGN